MTGLRYGFGERGSVFAEVLWAWCVLMLIGLTAILLWMTYDSIANGGDCEGPMSNRQAGYCEGLEDGRNGK